MSIYRFYTEASTPYHRFDTGANYPGCSRDNPGACAAIQFTDAAAMRAYAAAHGEQLVRVADVDEAMDIVEGIRPLNPSQVEDAGFEIGTLGWVAVAGALYWFLRRKS